MTRIERPPLPVSEQQLARQLTRMQRKVKQPPYLESVPRAVNIGYRSAIKASGIADFLGKRDEVGWLLRRGVQWGVGLYQICSSDHGSSEVAVDGQIFCVPNIGPDSLAGSLAWLEALCIAWLVRDQRSAQQLGAIDLDVPNAPLPGVETEPYVRVVTEAFAAYANGESVALATAERARALTRPEALTFQEPGIAEGRFGASLDILIALLRDDEGQFVAAVRKAVASHAAYIIDFDRTHREDLLLPWIILGLAARGVDRGWKIEVDSDYFPGWLVYGEAG